MSIVSLGGLSVSESSYHKARKIVENKPAGVKKSADDVLASLRQMMPGWNISTSSSNWSEGFRNIEICSNILNRMAEDPDSMIRYKALILDLEDAIPALEELAEQKGGNALEFGIVIDPNGGIKAMGIIRTLMGEDIRTVFDLPTDQTSWQGLIQQKLDALRQGQVEEADGSRSWLG